MQNHEASITQARWVTNLGVIGLHVVVYAGLLGLSNAPLAISAGLAMLLIWISTHDLQTFEIPDIASGLLLLMGLGVAWSGNGQMILHVAGAMIWAGAFAGVALAYRRVRGFDGLGLGDAKLMAGAGAWLGIMAPISVVLGASLSGIGFLVVQRGLGRVSAGNLTQSPIAFGPYLCFFIWVVWLFGPFGG